MAIHVEFKDFQDMVDFARLLIGQINTGAETQAATISATPAPAPPAAPDPAEEEPWKGGENGTGVTQETEAAYTLEEVRAKLASLQKAGKRTEVQALITGYGVKKLTEIPEESYTDLMEKAGEL